jgi:hypothetical protein
MGGGKTVCALTAAAELLKERAINRLLVIAPLKVCREVWASEYSKWEHLQHLDVGVAVGAEAVRKGVIEQGHQITVINFENLKWLFKHYGKTHTFDALLVDELSKLKVAGGVGFKALRPHLKKFNWRVGMSATPVSEDWLGLYGQMMVVDGGAALGTRMDKYKERFFFPTDFQQYNWALRDGAAEEITALIRDTVYTVPDYRDELPDINYVTLNVCLPEQARDIYNTMRDDFCAGDIEAGNAAVLSGKLQQISAGFLYRDDSGAIDLHTAKLDALGGWVGQGAPVVVAYSFIWEREQVLARYPYAVTLDEPAAVERWNRGEIDILLMHPKSGGHGLNLAQGGSVLVWLSPVWSRDLYVQTNARLWRRGQTNPVTIVEIVASDTVDEAIQERVEGKGAFHKLFLQHLQQT